MKWFVIATLGALAACGGNSGTVSVTLTTAPGSHLLDNVQSLHVTNTNPMQVHDVARSSDGFDLALVAVGADGRDGDLDAAVHGVPPSG